MKFILILQFTFFQMHLFAQWSTLENSPFSGRHDDIFFINDSVGWVASGSKGIIYKTQDGGNLWIPQFFGDYYLRSIEFATPLVGYCGALNSHFLKTIDGGETWTDIINNIQPRPQGICGLSAPTPEVIFGCGIWSSPAFLIKSSDGGHTWTHKNMSHLASSLIDVHFISPDTGFVCGRANPAEDGGIILHTIDGGESWTSLYKTMIPFDIVWKIQSPDGKNYFGSIDATPGTGNLRILKSNDSGMHWQSSIVSESYIYSQMVGFIDSLTGWIGGKGNLFETSDGGATWQPIFLGADYNRFIKVNENLAYMTGNKIYKYNKNGSVSTDNTVTYQENHSLNVSPNPAIELINIEIDISNRTYCQVQLFTSEGQLIHNVYDGILEKGVSNFSYNIGKIPPQIIYVTLKTNEGLIYRKLIKI